jgi:hypothetical protein
MRVRINARIAEPVYVQRSVRFQYSQTFLDPFVAPNKIITHFLLIAVVPEILDIVRRVADDNIGGVGFDPSHTNDTVFVVYFIDLSYPAVSPPPSPSPSLPQQTGWEVDEITLLTSSGSPTAGLTLLCNSTNSFLFYCI